MNTVEKIRQISELMTDMTIVEFAMLADHLRDRFDIQSSIAISVKTEPSDYQDAPSRSNVYNGNYVDVIFRSFGTKKINCIKLIREITGWGLKESKDFSEGVGPDYPTLITGITRQEAEDIQDRFTAVTGIVDIV